MNNSTKKAVYVLRRCPHHCYLSMRGMMCMDNYYRHKCGHIFHIDFCSESLVYQYLKCIYIKNRQMFQYVWIEKVQFQGLKRHMVITHIPWILWCMSWQEAQLPLSLSTLSAVARGGPFHGAMASVPSRAEIHVKWIYMEPAWHGPELYLKTSVELNSSQASQISKKIKFKHSILHKCVDKEWNESPRKFLVQVLG